MIKIAMLKTIETCCKVKNFVSLSFIQAKEYVLITQRHNCRSSLVVITWHVAQNELDHGKRGPNI